MICTRGVPLAVGCRELTVQELVNRFPTGKKHLTHTSDITPRTWQDYYLVCKRATQVLGLNQIVSDLVADRSPATDQKPA